MAISEEARHEMYERLIEVLGRPEATTLIEHLPPVGWADVATKRDLEALELSLRADMTTLGSDLRREFQVQMQVQTRWVLSTTIALFAAGFGGLAAMIAVSR